MAYTGQEVAAVYALDLKPRLNIRPSSALGLYYDRPYQEYRILRPVIRIPSSTQLPLFPEES